MTPAEYEAAKRIAAEGEEAARLDLARREDLSPELLFYLAGDAAPGIRGAVAANAATPAQADRKLARDDDPGVRAAVGRKLAPRAPELAVAEDKAHRLAWETLSALAADAAEQVRAVIAEEVAALPDAPRALILQLAYDAAMAVAGPVIRLSPLLDEADLLALIEQPPVPETVVAVARRPALSAVLSDAVIASAQEAAVTALLENPSAAIREAALDGLIADAATRIAWQAPLVRRPVLPARAAQALARIVAEHLLQPLAERPDLDPALAEELRARVTVRLAAEETPAARFEAAAQRGDRAAMAAALAEAAGLPVPVVERAAGLQSPKAIVSLCWQAGFGLSALVAAQTVLGRIAPKAALIAPAEGGWPLGEAEMRWQIELLQEPEVAG